MVSGLLTFEPVVVFFEASDSICGWPGFLFLWQMRAVEKREITKEKNKQTIIYKSDILTSCLVSAEDGKYVNTLSHLLFSHDFCCSQMIFKISFKISSVYCNIQVWWSISAGSRSPPRPYGAAWYPEEEQRSEEKSRTLVCQSDFAS